MRARVICGTVKFYRTFRGIVFRGKHVGFVHDYFKIHWRGRGSTANCQVSPALTSQPPVGGAKWVPSTSTGPSVVSTASRCGAFNPASQGGS